METYSQRLSKLIKDHASGKHTVFARKIGIPKGTFQSYVDGKLPKPEYLLLISKKINVSIDWLLTGEGEIYLKGSEKSLEGSTINLTTPKDDGPTESMVQPIDRVPGLSDFNKDAECDTFIYKEGPDRLVSESKVEYNSKIAELIKMTKLVLESGTNYSDIMITNIHSLHHALVKDKDIESRIGALEEIIHRPKEASGGK